MHRHLARLGHHGVPGGQRADDGVDEKVQREIPRSDHQDDPERVVRGVGRCRGTEVGRNLHRPRLKPVFEIRQRLVDVGDGEVDLLHLRLGGVLPQVRPERFDQFLLVLDQQGPQPLQLADAPVQSAGDAGVERRTKAADHIRGRFALVRPRLGRLCCGHEVCSVLDAGRAVKGVRGMP